METLLPSYSSFKSLPAALSQEQLNLEGRGLVPEEVDGAAAQDSGTQNDSHRVTAEVNDTTSNASKVSQEREPPVVLPRKPQKSPGPIRHVSTSQIGGSSENGRPSPEIPSAASRRKPESLSPRSSLASVVESAASEHTAQKAFRRMEAAPSEEVRIVSPETDSGFMGSEASRVSPLAQPQRRRSSYASTGAESALPGGVAATATLQPAAHPGKEPDATEPLVTATTLEGAAQRRGLANAPLGSPPTWTNSVTSEMEPDTDGTDSEDRGGIDACKSPPSEMRCSPTSSTSLSPARTRSYSLLSSRLERDQAIVALQNEVSQLRRSLEETLHRPQGSPKRSLLPHTSRARVPSSQGSAHFSKGSTPKDKTFYSNVFPLCSKPFGENMVQSEDPAPVVKPEEWTRRASLSQDGTQVDLASSESDRFAPKHQSISASKTKSPKQSVLRGPYAGTQYSFLTPEPQEPKACRGSTSCPPGQEERSQPRDDSTPEQDVKEAAEDTSAQGKPNNRPQPQPPGLWYLAVPAPTASVGYVAAIPVAPYQPPPVRFCAAPAPTSTSPSAGLPGFISPGCQAPSSKQPREHLRHSLRCDFDGRCDLDRSLSWAIAAAEGLKLTTKRMSRSLASELGRARSLRGSCLF
ncbi:hypothetical protein lerEdw1_006794 [Lerista edwardsae]|nr:hypothetical protein lerEdw1_006794 [Lerista edwardsae]